MGRANLGEPTNEGHRECLISRARRNWTKAISATDLAISRGKSGANAMRAERHWMNEYRRLGGKLPVTDK